MKHYVLLEFELGDGYPNSAVADWNWPVILSHTWLSEETCSELRKSAKAKYLGNKAPVILNTSTPEMVDLGEI